MFNVVFLLLIQTSWASPGWDLISETKDCQYDVGIKAKEGEKSNRAILEGMEYVLFPDGNYVFMMKNPIPLNYDSYNRRTPDAKVHFRYRKPSLSSYLPSEIEITKDGIAVRCKLEASI